MGDGGSGNTGVVAIVVIFLVVVIAAVLFFSGSIFGGKTDVNIKVDAPATK
jgi:hypothetical protein